MGHLGVNRDEVKQVVVVEVEDDDGDEERENGSEVVRWDKLLPSMMLRVLLVEADDSTRQILAALLRKCNYKVAAISDGLEAWEILKRRHNNIDLILTELDLPSISGYALLTLIMEHDGCKNIPVVIMSSQDSISTVLKCMLKGAADFLIKPVRRNELKNLWRHVWRRLAVDVGCNAQNTAARQHRAQTTFEHDPASYHSSDNVSSSWKISKSSEKASDAQDLLLSRHREGIGLSHKETAHRASNVRLEGAFAMDASDSGQKEIKFTAAGIRPSDEADVLAAFEVTEDKSCALIATEVGRVVPESQRHTAYVVGHGLPEPSKEAVDLIGRITKHRCTRGQSSSSEELNRLNTTPELELTLRRSHDAEAEEIDEKHVLNHSKASAFSRYSGNKKLRTFFPSTAGDLKDVEELPDSSPWPKAFTGSGEGKPKDFAAQSAHSEASSLSSQVGLFPLPGVIFDGAVWTGYAPMFQPVYSPPTVPNAISANSAFQREESPFLASPSLYSDVGTHSSVQGYTPPGEATNKFSRQVGGHEHKARESVDPSGSSTPCNDDATQQKSSATYGSVSEVTDVNATAPSMMATSAMEESVRDDGSNSFDHEQFRSRMGHHSAEREAALAKFRLKRKGRCFEKKVRYQSRKRLAEQRPRVKGQFVRQAPADPVLTDVDKP